MRQRLFQILRTVGAVTLLGLLYVLWGGLTRLWLPCPFHLLTGLDCPGCGVTRMCRALLRLDLSANLNYQKDTDAYSGNRWYGGYAFTLTYALY